MASPRTWPTPEQRHQARRHAACQRRPVGHSVVGSPYGPGRPLRGAAAGPFVRPPCCLAEAHGGADYKSADALIAAHAEALHGCVGERRPRSGLCRLLKTRKFYGGCARPALRDHFKRIDHNDLHATRCSLKVARCSLRVPCDAMNARKSAPRRRSFPHQALSRAAVLRRPSRQPQSRGAGNVENKRRSTLRRNAFDHQSQLSGGTYPMVARS